MNPEGRIVVVTGAAGGIGGALVRGLLAGGARTVVATDLDGEGVKRLSEELGPDKVLPRELDVCDEAATLALVGEIESSRRDRSTSGSPTRDLPPAPAPRVRSRTGTASGGST